MSIDVKKVNYELVRYDSDSSEELMNNKFELNDSEELVPKQYDPDSHCSAKHPTSYLETFINFFKAVVGIGIFSLPAAFAQVGYITGSIGLVIVACLSLYCEKILIDTQNELAKRRHLPCMNFQETAEAAFLDGHHRFRWLSRYFRTTVKVLINTLTFGSACVYNVVIAENMKEVLDPFLGETSVRWYMLYLLVPLVLINLIRNLKFIAPLSAFSSIFIIITITSVLFYIFQTPIPLDKGRPFVSLLDLPLFAGTVFFANSCITMILPLRNEMKNPKSFSIHPWGVLTTGCTTVLVLYWIFGVAGYLKYGDKVAESVTLNLPKHNVASTLVQCGLALATFLSTPLNNYVLFELLVEDFLPKDEGKRTILLEYLIHIFVVIASVAVSCLIPNLSLLLSLLGAGANAFLTMSLPATIHLMTIGQLSTFQKTINYFIIVLSVIFILTGIADNVRSIIKIYSL